MKRSKTIAMLASTAGLMLGFAGTATAHDNTGWLCRGNVSVTQMYGDGPGQGPVDWIMTYGEAFRVHRTENHGGTFWSYGHSSGSYPYDYWVRTGELNCS